MPGPETKATKIVLDRFNAMVGCRAVKVHAQAHQRGWPDIDAVWWGLSFKPEMKAPGKLANVSAIQQITMNEWSAVGGVTGVASDWSHILAITRAHKHLLIAAFRSLPPELVGLATLRHRQKLGLPSDRLARRLQLMREARQAPSE